MEKSCLVQSSSKNTSKVLTVEAIISAIIMIHGLPRLKHRIWHLYLVSHQRLNCPSHPKVKQHVPIRSAQAETLITTGIASSIPPSMIVGLGTRSRKCIQTEEVALAAGIGAGRLGRFLSVILTMVVLWEEAVKQGLSHL